ncbi:MAG TPA: hypothetical protein K8V97_09455, partial [Jeotgalicoccus aerolatus]|nr:hypothetical protein [Jeotgalicoccus aerolatus]
FSLFGEFKHLPFLIAKRYKFIFFTELSEIKDAVKNNKYDLIISNFPIEDSNHSRIICVENFPSRADMKAIMENIMTVKS